MGCGVWGGRPSGGAGTLEVVLPGDVRGALVCECVTASSPLIPRPAPGGEMGGGETWDLEILTMPLDQVWCGELTKNRNLIYTSLTGICVRVLFGA